VVSLHFLRSSLAGKLHEMTRTGVIVKEASENG
jgi:hypothetical protein